MSCLYIIWILMLELASGTQNIEANLDNFSSAPKVKQEYQSPGDDTDEIPGIDINAVGFQQITGNIIADDNSSDIYPLLCDSRWDSSQDGNISENLNGKMCVNISETNSTNGNITLSAHYSTLFAAVAASLSAVIFFFGILGNILVVVVIARTRSMHTTTNCYLLSLSVADSLVLLSATLPAIPEPFLRVEEWVFGRVMCSLLIFLQYLGIDCSSLSITAFTIERYIAICHPMKAQTMCTVSRAKRIIAILWIFTILYCSPWLGLTEIQEHKVDDGEPILMCKLRLARPSYFTVFMIDLIVFYVIPLIIATVLYLLIGRILFMSRALRKSDHASQRCSQKGSGVRRTDSRVQVVRMLIVVVLTFALLWLPYRVMVVYNSVARKSYLDMWFLLFARTMIYVNCAINPVLYNIMSVKFKRAFRNHLSCWHRRFSTPSNNYSEVPTDVWATKRVTFSQLQAQSKVPPGGASNCSNSSIMKPTCMTSRNSQTNIDKQLADHDGEANTNNVVHISSQHGNSVISFAEQAV